MTMAIPALGISPLGANQMASNADGSLQQNAQTNANQQPPSNNTQNTAEQSEQSSDQTTGQQDHSQDSTETSNGAEDRSLMSVLQQARTSYKQIKDVNATVATSTTVSSGDVEQSYNATLGLSYEQPNKFRFEVLKPEAQAGTVIASNGTTTTFYDPSSNTVSTVAMSDMINQDVSQASVIKQAGSVGQAQAGAGMAAMGASGMTPASLNNPTQLLQKANVSYEGTKTVNGYETDVISIEDTNASLGYSSSTTVYLDQKTSLPVKVVSNNTFTSDGETTTVNSTIVVRDLKVNTGIPDSVFEPEVPEDAEHVDTEPTAPDEAAYYQVDFVEGEPIENLRGAEGTYTSDELIRFAHGSSEDPITRRSDGEFTTDKQLADRIESQDITVENGTAEVTFTVTEGEPVTLTLAGYEKIGPGWSPETESQQEFIDAETGTFSSGTHTLTVDLPSNETSE